MRAKYCPIFPLSRLIHFILFLIKFNDAWNNDLQIGYNHECTGWIEPPYSRVEEQFLGNIEWRLKLIVGLDTHKQTWFNMVQVYPGR
jgi:hypothetical protein